VRRGWLSVFSTLAIGLVCLAAPLRAQFVYVANLTSNNVSAYRIGTNGALTPVPESPFAAGAQPRSVAVDPTARFVYVANAGSSPSIYNGSVSAYSIGANGALTPVPGSPFAAGTWSASVAVDPTGKFVYVANTGLYPIKGSVSGYSIGANGALTPVPGSPFTARDSPSSVAVDPTANFVYVANYNDSNVPNISGYSIGANGTLTPAPGSPYTAGSSPISVTVDPTGKFAYVANAVGNNISAFSIGANGALHRVVPGSPFAAPIQPVSVAVDPTAKFVYVANLSGNHVTAFSIGTNGALTPVPGSPFAGGDEPYSVAVDPTAKFAYVANAGSNNVTAYNIGTNGALTPVPGSPFAAGITPYSVAITPLVPFASSFAKLEIAKQGFVLGELFTLGATSNGINPLTQNLALQIGTFSVTISPGSFNQIALRIFVFQGVLNGVDLSVQILALGNNIFALAAESKSVNLTGLTNPVTVVLTIGNNRGSTAVTAQFR
jgi:6-phosphogluconolactonase